MLYIDFLRESSPGAAGMNETEQDLFHELADALDSAVSAAVSQLRRGHPGEHFYAYILFTTPLLEHACLSANTDEALACLVRDAVQREELRWAPPEWKYHLEGHELFERVDEVLGCLLQVQGYEEPEWKKRWDVFSQVLRRLDSNGVFGNDKAREGILVNIMWGDQDCVAHVESARELNPMSSYIRYAKDELPTLYAWAKEIEGSRSMYKEEGLARVRRAIKRVEDDLRQFGS